MSNTTIQLKKSGLTGNTPADLVHGELAINYADGKLFYKNGVGIKAIENQKTFSTINSNNSLIIASTPTDILSLVAGNNIVINTNTISKSITIGFSGSLNDNYARNTANSASSNTVYILGIDYAQNNRIDAAYAAANISNSFVNSGGTVTGNVIITGSLTIGEDFIVEGNTTYTNISAVQVDNPIIFLANNNVLGDTLDIGFVGLYNNGANSYTGLFRDPTLKEYFLFKDYTQTVEANTLIDINDSSFVKANLIAQYIKANLISDKAIVGGVNILDFINRVSSNTIITQGVDNTQNNRIDTIHAVANVGSDFVNNGGVIGGDVFISQDLTVTGNLSVLGSEVKLNTASIDINSSFLLLANNNTFNDILDFGFAGTYNDGDVRHAGLFRDPTVKEFLFFDGYTPNIASNTLIDINDSSFSRANVQVDYVKGNLIASTVTLNGTDLTGKLDSLTSNTIYSQEVDNWQNTSITSVDSFAQSAYDKSNSANVLAQGAFNKANNALPLTGGIIAGNVTANNFIANSTVYTSDVYSSGNNFTVYTTGSVKIHSDVNRGTYVFGTDFGYGGIKLTGDGTYGYLVLWDTYPYIRDAIQIGDNILIDNHVVTKVIGPYTEIDNPGGFYEGRYGFKLAENFGLSGYPDGNVGSFTIPSSKQWTFGANGNLIFPDSTLQNTAFTGTAIDEYSRNNSNNAYNQANNANSMAIGAYSLANTHNTQITVIQGVNDTQNTNISAADNLAQGAFNQANSANNLAQSAYDNSNTKFSSSGGSLSGAVTINNELYVTGNIHVTGNITSSDINSVNISNSIIYLAGGNVSNTVDIGIVGHFIKDRYQHTGMVRDHVDGTWKFFSNVTSEPGSTVDFANGIYDNIRVGGIISPTATINGLELYNYSTSSYAQANATNTYATSAYEQANAANNMAVGAYNSANNNGTLITIIQGVNDTQNTNISAADNLAQGAFNKANTVGTLAQAAFDKANTGTSGGSTDKTYTFYQSSAPATSNAHDLWVNSDTGVVYENFGSNTSPVWAEFGPTGVAVNTAPGIISATNLNINYTPATTTGYGLSISAANTQGGTGYADFLKVTNTTSGATNPNKSLRMNSTGSIEIINSAYTSTLMLLSDAGAMSVSGSYQVNGKQAVNGPAFRAYIDSGQAITSGSQQKVTFGSETFDTNGNFSSSRFTPTVEGYYQLNATVRIEGNSGTGEVMITIWKNGSEYARGTNEGGTEQGANWYSMQVSDLAYANGTGDYFEIYIQQTSGGNRNTTAGTNISYFSGSMVRGA